ASRFSAASRANVPPFYVMDLLAAANARAHSHDDLCNLVAGQPSTPAPGPVRNEAKRLIDSQLLGYTPSIGITELREAIADHHQRRSEVDVGADDVVVTTGSSGGFLLAFLAAFEAGDRVIMANPGYACYRNVLRALGCEVVEIDCGPESRFQPTLDQIEAVDGPTSGVPIASPANRTGAMIEAADLDAVDCPIAGVLIASPANPTGTMIEPAELDAIARWCEARGVRLISDEIYHGITYGAAPVASTWQSSRTAVVFGSFSKFFSMTGWR